MNRFLTPTEGIVLDIVFGMAGESRFNREIDDWGTKYKYIFVASRAPKLSIMHTEVNDVLRAMAENGYAPFQICPFKRGDRYHYYKNFPTSVSRETVRRAWVKSGMHALQREQWRQKRIHKPSH